MSTWQIVFEDLKCMPMGGEYAREKGLRVEEVSPVSGATPVYVTRVSDTLYIPELNLQIVGGALIPHEAIHDPWVLDFERETDFQNSPVRCSSSGSPTAKYEAPFEVTYSEKNVCVLSNFYSSNFGHWVSEELVRVVALEHMGYDGDYVVAGLPRFAFEFLRLLGIDSARLIKTVEKPTIFKSATFVTSVRETDARKYRELYMLLRSRILAIADSGQPKLSRRIWMARGFGVNEGRYEPSNAEEVYRILERNGFDIIDMATLTLSAQIAAARDAQILAGAHGAAFVHTLFMQPGSTVIECFEPSFINPSVFNICHIMKHRYSMLVHANAYGAYSEPDGLMVDPIHLELVLQHCE